MSKQQKHIDEVIMLRILENRSTKREEDLFEEWLKESKEHEELYRQFRKTAELTLWSTTSAEKSWEAITRKAKSGEPVPSYIELPSANTTRLWGISQKMLRVAAAVVFLIGASFLLMHILSQPEQLIISGNNYGPDTPYVLPDGSQVFLNNDAELTIMENFGDTNRRLSLKGEAFFEVERNEDLPFVVGVQNTTVSVLGTSFNVFSDSLKEVKVSVVTGIVEFFAEDTTAKVRLQKGEEGQYRPQLGAVTKAPIDNPNFLSWKTGVFTFDHTPVQEALQQLAAYYNQPMVYEHDTNRPAPELTTTFDQPSLEAVLDEIQLLLNASTTIRNDTIIFTPRH
ncbi:FecR family protein [Gracilimonas mengyeensis]|uniref:FecR family protein n=1 Tax=Gracilimonas mengyeensis TaxID=1302730 RepID=A0A521CT04_9BACT|nr:FecR domain-containing protein [Gracilimonas mengyeensis]SMO61770.1 FecR family protein [Gracilimonas mengyeensis]